MQVSYSLKLPLNLSCLDPFIAQVSKWLAANQNKSEELLGNLPVLREEGERGRKRKRRRREEDNRDVEGHLQPDGEQLGVLRSVVWF